MNWQQFHKKKYNDLTNKTSQDMNNSLQLTVDRLQLKEGGRRLGRCVMLVAAMLLGGMTAQAQWTDANTGVTFTPISGTTGYNGEDWGNGCDGSTSTKHGGASNAGPWYMVLQASEEVKLTGYTITTANDNASNAGRSPYTWKIQGSNTNNGSDWVDIASVTYDNTIQNVNYTEYEFSCSTDNYYTYFRFYITAINGGNYMQYSEFHPIGEVRPLEPGTSGGGGSTGPTSVGYVITNGSVYLGGTSTDAIGTFNPKTCLWTGTSSGTWRNSAGYYLYNYSSWGNHSLRLDASNTSNWTLSGTESGNTGQKINQTNQNSRYIRYNNGWTYSNSNNATNAVFAVTKTTYNASYTVPAIGGATIVSSLGSNDINTIATNAAYTQKYYDYIFRNGAHHYVDDNDETYLGTTAPSASTFTYIWSLEGADGYATIDSSNGQITYSNSTSSDFDVTVKLTATSTKKTFVVTKTVTLKPVRIYYQVNATAEPSAGGKVYVGTSSGTPSNSTATISGNVLGSYPTTNFQPYLIAAANDGYEFKWWSTTSEGSSASVEATYRPTISLNLGSTTSGNADVRNYYAQFGLKPTFYFSATAVAGAGGTANASVASSVLGEHWNSTSATTTATFTALPNTSYEFVGWSETENGAIVSTDNPYTVDDFSSTSTNSESPATLTLYAHFLALPTAITTSEASLSLCAGGNGTFTYSLTPAEAYENVAITSNDPSVATVSTSGHTVTVTAVAAGTTSIALAAKNASGDVLCGASVSVTVPTKWSTPSINYNDVTGKINITYDDGATIYYNTGDGSQADPTTSSTLYTDGGFTQSTATTIKAIAVGEGHCPSEVASLTLGKPATPVITYANNTVTITCATEGATIYYSYGASPATPNTSYSAPFTLPESPTKIKAVAILQGISSDAATTENLYIKLPAPTITINNSGVATITAEYDATIRDSVNGAVSWSNYTSGVQLTNPQTIYACAIKEGYISSDTVWKDFISTGTGGGKVVLDDREDHSWAYYNPELGSPIRSWNPADVKITYHGNGTKTVNTTNNTTPSSSSWTANATSVQVSNSEADSIFIYFKTLERLDGSTSDNPTGLCEYTTIPNPFSVRPTYQYATGNLNKYCGFYMWRIKDIKNGKIYDAATNGSQKTAWTSGNVTTANMLYAEGTYYFQPDDEYGMEVELEAMWARAYVTTGSTSMTTYADTYERNFHVVTSTGQTASNYQKNYPVTISSRYPDGSNGGGSFSAGNFTAAADTKIEYISIGTGTDNSWNANGKNFIIGRGCSGTIYQINGSTGTGNLSHTIRIESGTITRLHPTNSAAQTYSGTLTVRCIIGCDYDRAKEDNEKLSIAPTNTLIEGGGAANTFSSANNRNNLTYDWCVKSGKIQASTSVDTPDPFYLGNYVSGNNANSVQYIGKRRLIIEGGEMGTVAAGIGPSGNNYSNYTVNDGTWTVLIRMTGGTVNGSIYGAAVYTGASGDRKFVITGGEVKGWIAGGCNGTETSGGELYGDASIYFGGNAQCPSGNTQVGSSYGGNIFGAGCGISGGSTVGRVNNSTVVIADNSTVGVNVYGGGNYGYVRSGTGNKSDVYVLGGTVNGSVFGGSNQQQGQIVNITMKGGTVLGGVYGGSNSSGTVAGPVTMHIDGGTVGDGGSGDGVFGGGYGSSTSVSGHVEVTVGANVGDAGATINGNVYGGSADGSVNSSTSYHTYVTLNAGTINGSLYGGGYGVNNNNCNVNGPVQVKVYGGTVTDAVYGGNNAKGAPQSTVYVDIYGTDQPKSGYALSKVFGGGNAANYGGKPLVKVHNCDNSIEYVFGGGNAAQVQATDVKIYGGNTIGYVFGGGNGTASVAANVTDSTHVDIFGGTIGHVFGGSNTNGTIGGTIKVKVNKQGDTDANGTSEACVMKVGEVYGGGNLANGKAGTIAIGCTGTLTDDHSAHPENIGTTLEGIGTVYGGANQANIGTSSNNSNITVNINDGIVANVFGGNNTSGTIYGTITVNVEKTGSCGWYVGNVYGGGNLATYTGSPAVNIKNGTVSQNVYGGGKGLATDHSKGQVTGNPAVTIGDASTPASVAIVSGNVFGGGDAGNVSGTPAVSVVKCNTVVTTAVYGGGNAADVTATNVTVNGGTIGDVFGGGNGAVAAANVTNNTSVAIHGGTISRVFAGNNTAGTIGGSTAVTIDHSNSSCTQSVAEVYGGGNLAAGKAGTVTINCGAENIGDVYGGANQADIGTSESPSNITLNINGGQIANVFGGNNTSGTIYGTITVNVNKAPACSTFSVGNVYGGGNMAPYTGSPAVNILNGTVSHNVYGGGKGSSAIVTGSPQVTIGDLTEGHSSYAAVVTGDVYGGGDAAAVATGTPVVHVLAKDNTSVGNVYGGGNAADVPATSVTIDGGTITNVYGGGHGDKSSYPQTAANVTGAASVIVTGGTITNVFATANSKGSVGSATVNIAKGNTSRALHVSSVFGGGNQADGIAGTLTIGCTGTGDGEGIGDVYGGANAADITGAIALNITAGKINRVFGGNNASGTIGGAINVTINKDANNCLDLGTVFGGGNKVGTTNAATVTLTNGTVNTGIYGGCNSSGNMGGLVTVNLNGGQVGTSSTAGNVFGGGLGAGTTTTGNVTVNVGAASNANPPVYSGTTIIYGDVYGGSALGSVGNEPSDLVTVNVLSGTLHGNVYGGGMGKASVADSGQVNSTVNVNIGKVTTTTTGEAPNQVTTTTYTGNATIYGMVFGCNNTNGSPQADVNVNVYGTAHTTNVNDLAALGALKGTNAIEEADLDSVAALYEKKTHDDSLAADAFYALTAVYGGGNQANYIPADGKKATVTVYGCRENTIKYVYGGGRAASSNETHVVIKGGHIYQAFAGGDGSTGTGANIGFMPGDENPTAYTYGSGNTSLKIEGGAVYQAFGGSNSRGLIRSNPLVDLEKDPSCDLHIIETFGGNNLAPWTGDMTVTIKCGTEWNDVYGGGNQSKITGNVTLNIEGGTIRRAFGGSKAAPIEGNVTVNVFGGSIQELYGGNNVSGDISGLITVNVDYSEDNPCPDTKSIDYVYGGGNLAAYAPTKAPHYAPQVNIIRGTVNQAVFGGGYGDGADVTANPRVIIGADREQRFMGPGEALQPMAPIIPNLPVVIGTEKNVLKRTLSGDVFGGGNAAEVDGDTKVIIKGSRTKIWNNVYGGGNAAMVKGNTDIEIGSAIAVSAPLIIPKGVNASGDSIVLLSSYGDFVFGEDDSAKIYYTTDGSTPTTSSRLYNGTAVTIPANSNIRAIRYYEGHGLELTSLFNSYPLQPIRMPSISVNGEGKYVITNNSPGTKIYYTTNGNNPNAENAATTGSSIYAEPITLGACQTLKAIAHSVSPHRASNIASVTTPVATPTISITDVTVDEVVRKQVTLTTATGGATLYYTTDGSQPDINNAGNDAGYTTKAYSSAFTLPEKSTTVIAVAAKSGCPTSAVVSSSITLPAPSISITNGKVSITSVIDDVAIYYTTDGSTPDPTAVGGSNPTLYYNGTPFNAPIAGTTIKAIATKSGLEPSDVTEFTVPGE